MNCWQLIFLQSKANGVCMAEMGWPAQKWDRPQETWLQKRLRYLRKTQRQVLPNKFEVITRAGNPAGEKLQGVIGL
jgi:hypothetical protein